MISVVVPAFNEEELLPGTVAVLGEELERLSPGAWEEVVVDDGSTDRTGSLLAALLSDPHLGPHLRVARHPENLGKGAAVRTGVLLSRGDPVLVCDADLSTPASELPRLMEALAAGAAIAVGCRRDPSSPVIRSQPPLRRLLGGVFLLLARGVTGLSLQDFNCGFKLFRGEEARALFAATRSRRWVWDVEVLALAARRGLAIREVPVAWTHRERSRVNPWRDGARSAWELLRLAVRLPRWRRGG